MTLRHFLAILRARAWLAVAILLATVSVAVAVAALCCWPAWLGTLCT